MGSFGTAEAVPFQSIQLGGALLTESKSRFLTGLQPVRNDKN